jgi:hypothetical protein
MTLPFRFDSQLDGMQLGRPNFIAAGLRRQLLVVKDFNLRDWRELLRALTHSTVGARDIRWSRRLQLFPGLLLSC